MGFGYDVVGSLGNSASSINMPYKCNFTGIQNINIHIENMSTDNIDTPPHLSRGPICD